MLQQSVQTSMPDSGASFSCRCTSSNVVDCLRDPEAVNDVRSRALARKTGAGIWRRSYGADLWSRFRQHVSRTLDRILTVTYFMMIALTVLLLLV